MKLPIGIAMLMVSAVLGCAAQPKPAGVAEAGSPKERVKTPSKTVVVGEAEAPPGWAEYCARYAAECDAKPIALRDIVLTPETWSAIVGVNKSVNEQIRPTRSINTWDYPDNGRGDCTGYVLLKQRMLVEAGFPRQALLITIVWTKEDTGHAVLIARTDKGDFVLDNLSSEVLLAYDTSYRFVKRQSPSNPNEWVYIDGDPWAQPLTAGPLRVSASGH